MNIFLKELKSNMKTLIFWCLGSIFLIAFGMGEFSVFDSTGQSINDIISQLPKVMKVVCGVGSLDLSTATGFYGCLYFYILLMGSIYAVTLGANLISKEESDKTAEFLLTKPVSRNFIISNKLSIAILNLLIFSLLSLITSIIMVNVVSPDENINNIITLSIIGMTLIELVFLSIGSALASIYKDSKKSPSLSISILLVTFFMSVIIDLSEKLEFLKYVVPFKYVDIADIVTTGKLEIVFVVLSIIIFIVLTAITFVFYKKRDITI
ncbi:MAG: ABC transporter permease subunit [Clostridium sp.]